MDKPITINDFTSTPSTLLRCCVKSLCSEGIEPGYIQLAPRYGLKLDKDGKLIEILSVPTETLPKTLVSRTPLVTKEGLNILEQLEQGIYGSADKNRPTYFAPLGTKMETTQQLGAEYLEIYIDTNKLLEERAIYVDPETFMQRQHLNSFDAEQDIPGNAFLCFGGVTRAAISEIKIIKSNK